MKARLLILILLLWCSAAQAQALTSETLIGWCQDARAVFTGLSGEPLLRQDQQRSNATACIAYLRGWLERENSLRQNMSAAAPCNPALAGDNVRLVSNFLTLAAQPGYAQKDINALVTEFGGYYCPPLPAQTRIQPVVMAPAPPVAAPLPQAQIVMMPPLAKPIEAPVPVAAAQPEPKPVEIKPPPKPAAPVIDPTQTRIISSTQSRMLEAGEQSAIQIIK